MVRLRFTRTEVGSLYCARSFGGICGVKGKTHCAISLAPTFSTQLRAGSCAKDAQGWGHARRWLCRRAKPRPPATPPAKAVESCGLNRSAEALRHPKALTSIRQTKRSRTCERGFSLLSAFRGQECPRYTAPALLRGRARLRCRHRQRDREHGASIRGVGCFDVASVLAQHGLADA